MSEKECDITDFFERKNSISLSKSKISGNMDSLFYELEHLLEDEEFDVENDSDGTTPKATFKNLESMDIDALSNIYKKK